ncbi:MAG: hypothetical protein ACM3ON_09395 [Chloroflexota bacterium]
MKMVYGPQGRLAFVIALLTVCLCLFVASCGKGKSTEGQTLVQANVTAAQGGTFKDRDANPHITVTIPPAALSEDAQLKVTELPFPPQVGPNQTAASTPFTVELSTASGTGRPTLSEPILIEIRVDTVPVHPQIGEIARLNGTQWERLQANFFKASSRTVAALTTATNASFRAVHRTLQTATGIEVVSGFDAFMNETFGNADFFTFIGLPTVLNNLSPEKAVELGVQIDIDKVPAEISAFLNDPNISAADKLATLRDPATTRALVKADAVVGVKGFTANANDTTLVVAGITCALCHITVTPTTFPGVGALPIGKVRQDGVPNSSMDVGAILALTPFAQDEGQATVDLLNSWGPGRFDIRALPDNPLEDNVNNPTVFPPIWNFIDLSAQGYLLGWDGLFKDNGTTNNALANQAEAVYDLVMHANGAFGTSNGTLSPEFRTTPPQQLVDALVKAETDAPGNVVVPAQKLLDVQAWMRSIASPAPEGFDETRAFEGFRLFYGKADCSSCHQTAEFTGPGLFKAITAVPPSGGLVDGIKVPGLRGVSKTAPYFHDGSAATLDAAVARLIEVLATGLTADEQSALVEYLKSL